MTTGDGGTDTRVRVQTLRGYRFCVDFPGAGDGSQEIGDQRPADALHRLLHRAA